MSHHFPQRYDGRKCFAPCPPGTPCHCRDAVRGDHSAGSLNTTPPLRETQPYPTQGEVKLKLEDDTPLEGGACNLDGDCEACQ